MTAPLSVSRPDVSEDATSPGARVVSVSPRVAAIGTSSPSPAGSRANPVFITPRVIDQRAFDDLTATLRALTDDALEASRKLATQIALAENGESGAKKASHDLQERLRLGARMLSAFQSQIVRIEESLAGISRPDGGGTPPSPADAADEVLARFCDQLDGMIERAANEIDSRIASIRATADEANARLAQALRSLAERVDDRGRSRSPRRSELSSGAD